MDRIGGKTFLPVEPVSRPKQSQTAPKEVGNFQTILEGKLKELKFSAHAQERLKSRGISLTENQTTQLENAVGKAAAKGARESLIMVGDLAFVVSIPKRTVITAMVNPRQDASVFTNIDSAVIS